ncbi:MAG: MAC/perforin domain-containing protein [Parvularculaceae bacterium]
MKFCLQTVAIAPLALAILSSSALAQPAPNGESLFAGDCDDGAVLDAASSEPSSRDKIMAAAGQGSDFVDPVTERVFKGFSLQEAKSAGKGEFKSLCWSRLDGIWSEEMSVSFDKSFKPSGWAGEQPSMIEFTHGTYTTPLYIVVEKSRDYDHEIILRSALGPGQPVRFTSNDGQKISDVLSDYKKNKIYKSDPINGRSETLTLDVSYSGFIRLRIGDRRFQRPRLDVSADERARQESSRNFFGADHNPKNLIAGRQGYDVTIQDPNAFLDNGPIGEVFAEPGDRDYQMAERLTVPIGLKLIPIGRAGTVYYDRLMASEEELQESTSSSFGFNVGVTVPVGGKNKKGDDQPESGGGDAAAKKIGASYGAEHASKEFEAMQSSHAVSSFVGYQRNKNYALVRDFPFTRLSSDFIDAVHDTLTEPPGATKYRQLIKRFGTHYPYAVTYGSAGFINTRVTEEAFSNNYSSFKQDSESGGLEVPLVELSATKSSSKELTEGSTIKTKFGLTTFIAVGGNGSWDQSGFSAGDTPYPILMDLRPLDELLNPMNFPGEPEIYGKMRDDFREAINTYLEEKGAAISNQSLLADVAKIEKWSLEVFMLACDSAGGREVDQQAELGGTITINLIRNPAKISAPKQPLTVVKSSLNAPLNLNCKRGRRNIANKSEIFSGTHSQIQGLLFAANADMMEYDYADFLDPDDTVKGRSPYFRVPDSNKYPVGAVVPGSWRLPHSDGAIIGLHWRFRRLE